MVVPSKHNDRQAQSTESLQPRQSDAQELIAAISTRFVNATAGQADEEMPHALQALEDLRRRLAAQTLAVTISSRLVGAPAEDIEAAVEYALKALGEFLQADHCHLAMFIGDGMTIENDYLWTSERVVPQPATHLRGVSLTPFTWSKERILNVGVLSVPRVADLPPEAEAERMFWGAQGWQAVLFAPIFEVQSLIGFLGLAVLSERSWSDDDVNLLRLVTGALSGFVTRQRARESEQRRLAVEELITAISTRFVTASWQQLEQEIQWTVQSIGEFLKVDRSHLVLFAIPESHVALATPHHGVGASPPIIGSYLRAVYEWYAPGASVRSDKFDKLFLEPFQWSRERYSRQEALCVPRVDALPPEARAEQAFWRELGAQSVLAVPLCMGQVVVGSLGCHAQQAERRWSGEDVRLLRRVGELIVAVLVRAQTMRALFEARAELEQRVAERTAELSQVNRRLQEEMVEREQAQLAVREAEIERGVILDALPAHVAVLDKDMRYRWVNRADREYYRAERVEDVVGRLCYEFSWGRSEVCPECHVARAMATGQVQELERITSDGRIWMMRAVPLRDAQGETVGAVEQAVEITEHKRMEDALRESEERYSRVFRLSPQAISITRLSDGRFVEVNDAFVEITGYSREEVIGRTPAELGLVHPADLARATRLHRMHGSYRAVETRFYPRHGLERTGLFFGETIEICGEHCLVQVANDITERKQAETALRNSEERYRRLVDLSPNLIGVAVGGKVAFVNAAGAHMLGAESPAEMVGRPVLDFVHPDFRAGAAARIEQMMQGQTVASLPEEKWLRLDGETVDVAMAAVPFRRGDAIAIQVVAYDITERKRAEQELIKSARLTALGQMAASLAHEINNPLQIIYSHLEMLMDFPVTAQERKEYLRVMQHEVERLKSVTRNVLDYARPRPNDASRTDVAQSIRHVLALAHKRLEQADIQVTIELGDMPPVALAPEFFTVVLLNLVVNALQAMNGMRDGQLHIVVGRRGEQVVVTLTDNGPAIPDDVLPHVFEPFYTTKSDGTGLGLWVSRELLGEAGTIEVHNLEGGQGVSFIVTLR